MPKMRRESCLCHGPRSTEVPEVSPADVANCGNHLSGYPKAIAHVVPSDVVCHESEVCVEVDETYLGGAEEGVHGRETENKAIVAVAAEEDGRGIGRIRLRRIADVSADSLHPFVEQCVTPGAIVHTDGWPGYNGIEAKGYTHEVTVLSQHDEPAHQLMPRVHRVASLLKRWLLGTHQGAVREKHLDYYLDEYTFRFNRRRSRARGLLFYRLLQNAVAVDPVPYGQLVGGQNERDHKI